MSSYRLEDFKTRIRTDARLDSGTESTALLVSYLNSVIKELQVDVEFPKTVTELSKTVGSSAFVDFSSTSDFDVANIISIRDEDGIGNDVKIMDKVIFDKVQPVQSSTSGYPKIAVPITDTKMNLYPYGTDSVWSVKYYAKHFDFSADSQILQLDDIAYGCVCDRTVSRLLLWKDDNRAGQYEGLAARAQRKLQKKFDKAVPDKRMLPGEPGRTNGDFERIFGDEY